MTPKVLSASKTQVECELHENHPLRLLHAEGRRIQCLTGMLWITAFDQTADFFLQPGGIFVVPNGGLVLIEAISHGRVRIDLPRSPRNLAYSMLARMLKGLKPAAGWRKRPV
jgi:hypothetical protein